MFKGAGLVGYLLEITQRYIVPNISVKIKYNVVNLDNPVEKLGNIVMRLNLHKKNENG